MRLILGVVGSATGEGELVAVVYVVRVTVDLANSDRVVACRGADLGRDGEVAGGRERGGVGEPA